MAMGKALGKECFWTRLYTKIMQPYFHGILFLCDPLHYVIRVCIKSFILQSQV